MNEAVIRRLRQTAQEVFHCKSDADALMDALHVRLETASCAEHRERTERMIEGLALSLAELVGHRRAVRLERDA